MSTRLNVETVETQIREMWDALDYKPCSVEDAINLNTSMEQAREVEAKLRARLAFQERLDAAAPALLTACQFTLQAIRIGQALDLAQAMLQDAINLTEPKPL